MTCAARTAQRWARSTRTRSSTCARGIPEKEAERLIVEGFFDPIMQRIPFEGVRGRFQQAIEDKMVAFAEEM